MSNINNGPRITPHRVNLVLANGTSLIEGRLRLPAGKSVGFAVDVAGTEPPNVVEVSLLDNGSEILRPLFWKFYKQRDGGPWLLSLPQIHFDCNRDVTVRLSATTNVAQDYIFQAAFFIDEA